jgi:hypothetical protein
LQARIESNYVCTVVRRLFFVLVVACPGCTGPGREDARSTRPSAASSVTTATGVTRDERSGLQVGDVQARYSLAQTLASHGRLQEATDEYLWLWQHMLEYKPAMKGVRGSFMLTEIGQLMNDYPPARARFAELRDAIGIEGAPGTATCRTVADWIDLSVTLGEADRVLRWFDGNEELLALRPDLEDTLQVELVPLLTERARWADIGRLYRDPLAALRDSLGHLLKVPPEMGGMRPAIEKRTREKAAVLVISLLAAKRKPDARACLEEVRRVMPGAETERVLLETARTAGVDLP